MVHLNLNKSAFSYLCKHVALSVRVAAAAIDQYLLRPPWTTAANLQAVAINSNGCASSPPGKYDWTICQRGDVALYQITLTGYYL